MLTYKEWKKEVSKRDNKTCRKCGAHKKLQAHHITNYSYNPALRTKVSNGITLCKDCLEEFYHLYGYSEKQADVLLAFCYGTFKNKVLPIDLRKSGSPWL